MGEYSGHQPSSPSVSVTFQFVGRNSGKPLATIPAAHYPLLVNPFLLAGTFLGSIM
jgi:hypothetical protein